MEYELYHDESKEGGYWHGILLVPILRKEVLVNLLLQARTNARYIEPLGIKKIRRFGHIYDCADAWVQVGVLALMSQMNGKFEHLFLGKRIKRIKQYECFREVIGAKFIVFCERDCLTKLDTHPDFGSKVETTFRMGLKGGIHYLGSEDEPIHIEKMHFDGYEHYHRNIDVNRIVGRLTGLREYCSISSRSDLVDDRTSNHNKEGSQSHDDCQLLQLTDLLIGCFRTVLGARTKEIHFSLAYPVKSLVDRYRQGYARMQNSRWRNSFWISGCYLDTGSWIFESIEFNDQQSESQLELPFDWKGANHDQEISRILDKK